jgi:hypothetical protein
VLADHLRGEERVGAGTRAEVEYPLTRREPAQLPRLCDPSERADGGLGNVRELGRIAEVLGPGPAVGKMKSFSGSRETDAYVFLISLFRTSTSISTSTAVASRSFLLGD